MSRASLLKNLIQTEIPPQRFAPRRSERSRLSSIAFSVTVGWLASSFSLQAYAAEMSFGNGGVRFNRDTTLQSDFVESHGAYQSVFGVINLDTNEKTPLLIESRPADSPESIFKPSLRRNSLGTDQDFRGTPGNAVPQPSTRYTFKANTNYVFYLESSFNGRPTGTLYSTDTLNPNQERQATFSGSISQLCQGAGMTLGWDDTGSRLVRNRGQEDRDFDDFVIKMRDTTCPVGGGEPPPVTSPIAQTPVAPIAPIAPAAGGSSFLLPALLGAGAIAGIAVAAGGGGGGDDEPEPIPEPLTILGSGTAVGVAALLQRRRSKKRKKD